MVRIAVIGIASLLFVGCGEYDGMTNHPNVIIDGDFGVDGMYEIIDSTGEWPTIHANYTWLSHAEIVQWVNDNRKDNTIYMVVSRGPYQEGCPRYSNPGHEESAGMTVVFRSTNHSAVSCIATDYINTHPLPDGSAMKRAVAHEFAHALGLAKHNPEPGHLMTFDYYGPDKPTTEDLKAMEEIRP